MTAGVFGCGSLGGFGLFRGFDPLRFGADFPSSLLFARFVDIPRDTQNVVDSDALMTRSATTLAIPTKEDDAVAPEIQQHAASVYQHCDRHSLPMAY